jgi:hypothetical protein
LEYLKEIGGVLGLFEKASSSSNQVWNSNIRNDIPRCIIKKPAGTITTSDNSIQKPAERS